MQQPDNGMDIIDSRDVIARIQELEEWRDAAIELLETARADLQGEEFAAVEVWMAEDGTEYAATPDWTETEHDELKILKELEEEASGSSDWRYGEALIRDSYFTTYAQDLAEDTGAIHRDAQWPLSYIDWDAAADALKTDYTSVEFDGVTYWIRS